jgi:hypothetical protein
VEDLTYKDHIFLDFPSFQFSLSRKGFPERIPMLYLPIKPGWLMEGEWEQNYYVCFSIIYSISCAISSKSLLIVVYCELKKMKHDPA